MELHLAIGVILALVLVIIVQLVIIAGLVFKNQTTEGALRIAVKRSGSANENSPGDSKASKNDSQ